MQIYISHSTQFDYKKELYEPLAKATQNDRFKLYLPHNQFAEAHDTRKIIEASNLILAEVSYPSTGQGIEIAWADNANIPIICIHKTTAKISSSIRLLCKSFHQYSYIDELQAIIPIILLSMR